MKTEHILIINEPDVELDLKGYLGHALKFRSIKAMTDWIKDNESMPARDRMIVVAYYEARRFEPFKPMLDTIREEVNSK